VGEVGEGRTGPKREVTAPEKAGKSSENRPF